MIALDHDVPMPSSKGGGHRLYPILDMQVGDSFFLPGKGSRDIGGPRAYARLTKGIILSTRQVVEGGVAGMRVWRTA